MDMMDGQDAIAWWRRTYEGCVVGARKEYTRNGKVLMNEFYGDEILGVLGVEM
jgi:hypothetical protein